MNFDLFEGEVVGHAKSEILKTVGQMIETMEKAVEDFKAVDTDAIEKLGGPQSVIQLQQTLGDARERLSPIGLLAVAVRSMSTKDEESESES